MPHEPTALRPQLTALTPKSRGDARVELLAPAVGLWRGAPPPGTPIVPGMAIGALEILGVVHELVAPTGVRGVVERDSDSSPSARAWGALARRPVEYGQRLLVLNSSAAVGLSASESEDAGPEDAADGLVFAAPSSGRFYLRPGPDKPPFVRAGDTLTRGQAIGLLEVMKTFNRVQYGGAGLPSPARVRAVLVEDGDDVAAGDPLLQLERSESET